MSERIPTGHRFYDRDGGQWMWTDEVEAHVGWQVAQAEAAWEETTIDYDSIPTLEELESGENTGPQVSLVDEPHAIALPDVYEQGYSYPLIVWFHEAGGNEEDIFRILPEISERNYLAISIRGDREVNGGFEWTTGIGVAALAEKLEAAIERLAEKFSINRDRVYLAGMGSGGTLAMELLLEKPEAFTGAASLNGTFPQLAQPLAHFRGLRGRRALLTTSNESTDVKVADLVAAGRLLYSAGMEVGTRIYQSQGPVTYRKMLREIDHWIMSGIRSAVRV
ncbi:hypothetical protein GC163_14555 [bacterium]|nr:hypothetical protein [bacterium]